MTGREALQAMLDGKRVRHKEDGREYTLFDVLHNGPFPEFSTVDDRYEVVEEPLTDEQIVEHLDRLATIEHRAYRHDVALAYKRAADLVSTRKVQHPLP